MLHFINFQLYCQAGIRTQRCTAHFTLLVGPKIDHALPIREALGSSCLCIISSKVLMKNLEVGPYPSQSNQISALPQPMFNHFW